MLLQYLHIFVLLCLLKPTVWIKTHHRKDLEKGTTLFLQKYIFILILCVKLAKVTSASIFFFFRLKEKQTKDLKSRIKVCPLCTINVLITFLDRIYPIRSSFKGRIHFGRQPLCHLLNSGWKIWRWKIIWTCLTKKQILSNLLSVKKGAWKYLQIIIAFIIFLICLIALVIYRTN